MHNQFGKQCNFFVFVGRVSKNQVILVPAMPDVLISVCQVRYDGGYLQFLNDFFYKAEGFFINFYELYERAAT